MIIGVISPARFALTTIEGRQDMRRLGAIAMAVSLIAIGYALCHARRDRAGCAGAGRSAARMGGAVIEIRRRRSIGDFALMTLIMAFCGGVPIFLAYLLIAKSLEEWVLNAFAAIVAMAMLAIALLGLRDSDWEGRDGCS